MGTIINVLCIIAGGMIGLSIGKFFQERFLKIINTAMALSIIAMSLSGIVSKMLVVLDNTIETQGIYMIIISLVIGAILGEFINLDSRLEQFGTWLKEKTNNSQDSSFINAFVLSSLTVCFGAMAIVGAMMDGINGDYSILLTKGILDFVIIMVMSASLGKGCLFSFIPVGILQGSVTLIASLIAPIMNVSALNNLSLVGSILILCIGINLLCDGKFRINVANLLPSVLIAILLAFI